MVVLLFYVIVLCLGVSLEDENEIGAQDNLTSTKQLTRDKRQIRITVKDMSDEDLEELVHGPYRKDSYLDFPSDTEELIQYTNRSQVEYEGRMKVLAAKGIFPNSSKWRPQEGSYEEY